MTITYIPIYEFYLSLHVLANAQHHMTRLNWGNKMLEKIPHSLKKELTFFKSMTSDYLNLMDTIVLWDESTTVSIEAGIEILTTLTDINFITYMLGYDKGENIIEQYVNGNHAETLESFNPEMKQLLRNPKTTRKKLIHFLYEYLTYYQKEHRRVEPWLIRFVHDSRKQFDKDPLAFMGKIHPRLTVYDDMLQFDKAKTYQFSYKNLKHVFVVPSSFVHPHLLLGIHQDMISTAIDVHVPGEDAISKVPEDFVQIMKALSDQTRLTILKMLLHHPYCIQQLSDLLNISEPAVSKHLRILKKADLIWSERQGHFVFYQSNIGRLDMLQVEIHQFIDMEF